MKNDKRALETECCVSLGNLSAISLPFSRINCFQDGRLLFLHRAGEARPRPAGTAWCGEPVAVYNGRMFVRFKACGKLFKLRWHA